MCESVHLSVPFPLMSVTCTIWCAAGSLLIQKLSKLFVSPFLYCTDVDIILMLMLISSVQNACSFS